MATFSCWITAMITLFSFLIQTRSYSTTIKITNECSYIVSPAISSTTTTTPPSTTGFILQPGESNVIAVPLAWSGRFWGRTLCSIDDNTGNFSCVTGDCGSSTVECPGGHAIPPVTLVELTLNSVGGFDFFSVSLVNGFNIPVKVKPHGGSGTGKCKPTGCEVNLNIVCPTELKVTSDAEMVGCKSTCQAFGVCCEETCKSSLSLQLFKSACPGANVYADDDDNYNRFSCASGTATYTITFCPPSSASSVKPGNRYADAVDDAGTQVEDSTKKFIAVVIVGAVCTFIAFKITVLLSNRGWSIGLVAGTGATSELVTV